jgi:SRSO17 transposase
MSTIIETVPVLKLRASELSERLLPELANYYAIYRPLFQRREQREQFEQYERGLMSSELANKSIESMVLQMQGDDPNAIRASQQFISQGAWDDQVLLQRHWCEVNQDLGDDNGVLILDGRDFPKQGDESVGVKRQMCGELGKIANCQAGVFVSYASSKGYTLLDRRLYLPAEWFNDAAYAQRRQQCGVPTDLVFQTKPELGLAMVKALHGAGTLRFGWLTCDEAFGRDTDFLDEGAAYVAYFAEVPHDTRVWNTSPQTAVPAWSGRGRKPSKLRILPGTDPAQTVAHIAATLPASAWTLQWVKEGTKGSIIAEFACLRVTAVRHDLPGPQGWLVLRRNPASAELKCFLSNAPSDTALATFVWLSAMRWPIECCFEEGKQELGMGDYQVRGWLGWHHHMTLVILAHFFLVRLKLRLKDDAPALTLPQTVLLLKAVLPKPDFDAQLALEIVHYRQRRNHAAYLSHRKKQLHQLNR